MTSKELIKRVIHRDAPPRIGFNFKGDGQPSDIKFIDVTGVCVRDYHRYKEWGRYPELLAKTNNFSGEVCLYKEGNIYGRFEQKTKGECIKGVLQDGWELLETYVFPEFDMELEKSLLKYDYTASDKYLVSGLPFAVFAPLRDMRHMDNALMDILLEPEYIKVLLDRLCEINLEAIRRYAKRGTNAAMIWDDLGTQTSTFFSPTAFREIFKPYYKKLADELHNNGMEFIVHSCGKTTALIPDFIEAGVDMLQFDQPELHGVDVLAGYGDKIAFYCPVDIQKVMPTGDREFIEASALKMVESFKKSGGGLVAMDYGNWQDIDVAPEWQQWARDIIINNAKL